MRRTQKQLGVWEPSRHLLKTVKPSEVEVRWPVSGRSQYKLNSAQQDGLENMEVSQCFSNMCAVSLLLSRAQFVMTTTQLLILKWMQNDWVLQNGSFVELNF
jgi:hypothetical protein